MADNKEIGTYTNNYLTEVVIRCDLVSPIVSLATELPKQVSRRVLEDFPIDEPKRGFHQQFEFRPEGVSTERNEFTEWNFHGPERKRRLAINPTAIFITMGNYDSFEHLRKCFTNLSDVFFDNFNDAQPSRLGLRYINNITKEKGDPLDWKDVISGELLGLQDLNIPEADISRNFHAIGFKFPEFNMNFRFGLHNPDFPAMIRQRVFVLDYDAYFKGLFEANDIAEKLGLFHEAIQSLFERSITDELRGVMKNE